MTRATVIVRRVNRRLPGPVVLPVAATEQAVTIWDAEQCMAALGIGLSTLYEWRRDGMPYVKRGAVVRYIPEDVRDWLRDTSSVPTPLRRTA